MPDTPTARLALYKSASDGSEDVDYTQDLGNNWDALDLAVGALACTSSTRPSSPWNGQLIRETNTGRLWVSNGSSPASGSWSEICTPGTAQTFTGAVTMSAGLTLNGATSTTTVVQAGLAADTNRRIIVDASGKLTWGSGSAAGDTNLYRSAANILATDDSLVVAGGLTVNGTIAATGNMVSTYTPAVTGHGSATWNALAGTYFKLGGWVFVKIYASVNAAGTGSSTFTLGLPSTPNRDTRQHISGYGTPLGSTAGNMSGVILSGGSGAMLDQVRDHANHTMVGSDLTSGTIFTLEGVYHE